MPVRESKYLNAFVRGTDAGIDPDTTLTEDAVKEDHSKHKGRIDTKQVDRAKRINAPLWI